MPSIARSSGCNGSCRSRPGTTSVNDRRVQLLCADPATAPHGEGVLVIDDTGDRKDGTATAHVARQYLGSVGKIDNGIVAVTSLWADERCYWPVHAVPLHAGGSRLPGRRAGSGVPDQAAAGRGAGPGRPRRPDSVPGGGGRLCLWRQPWLHPDAGAAKVPFVLALKPRKGTWAPAEPPTPRLRRPATSAGSGSSKPGRWRRVTRRFRDGHTETWWAADAQLGGWGPGPAAAAGGGQHRPRPGCPGTAPGTC